MTRPGARFVIGAWAVSRAMLLLAGLVVGLKQHWGLTRLVMHWDAEWYTRIALHGYTTDQARAFLPGWPLVLRALQGVGIPLAWGGVTVATLCSLGAALALWKIGGDRYGPWVAAAWCFAPMTIFTSVLYTESLFCVFGFWAWERMLRRRWAAMSVLLALACTVRVTGIFLVVAVFVWILTREDAGGWWRRVRPALWLAVPSALVLGYCGYLWRLSGDPLLWYHAQSAGWSRGFTWPWQTVYKTLLYAGPLRDQTSLGFSAIQLFELASWLVGGAVGVWCWWKRRWGEAAFVLIQFVALGTAGLLISVNRALLLWFPAWLIVGRWLARARRGRIVYGVCSAALAFAWAFLCLRGYWAS